MGHLVSAGSSGGGPPAGAVVVPMEAAAPASPTAAGARVSARVTWSGAAAAPPPAAGAAAGGALPGAAPRAPPPPPPAWTPLSARLALAAALFLLGCAAAGLALFAMILPPAVTQRDCVQGKACAATDGEVARLRTSSEYLLLAASSQMLAATMGLLVPARPVAIFGTLLGVLTSFHACDVLGMLVTCHGTAHGALALYSWLFFAVLWAAHFVGAVVSLL